MPWTQDTNLVFVSGCIEEEAGRVLEAGWCLVDSVQVRVLEGQSVLCTAPGSQEEGNKQEPDQINISLLKYK